MLSKWFSRLYFFTLCLTLTCILAHLFSPKVVQASPLPPFFINEIHYDNAGADKNEFIELVGISGVNLNAWSLHLYNGSNGNVYGNPYTFSDLTVADTNNGFGFVTVNFTNIGKSIQNGSPDGIVLADELNNVIQFLSYEGSFRANSGIAAGLMSNNIGVFEPSNTPLGYSLQLTGQGNQYQDFTWATSLQNTFGQLNVGQSLVPISLAGAIPVSEPKSISLVILVAFGLLIFSSHKILSLFLNKTPVTLQLLGRLVEELQGVGLEPVKGSRL